MTTYADDKMAYAVQEANYQSYNEITGWVKKVHAGVETIANDKYAQINALGTYEIRDKNGNLIMQNLAGMSSYVDDRVAKNTLIASFKNNGITNYSSFQQEVDAQVAKNTLIASFKNNGITNYSSFQQEVDAQVAKNTLIASFKDRGITSVSSLYQYAQNNWAGFDLLAELEDNNIHSISGLVTEVANEFAESTLISSIEDTVAYVKVYADHWGNAEVHLMGNVIIDSGKTFEYFGDMVGWTYVQNNATGERWQVLGLLGQSGIYFS